MVTSDQKMDDIAKLFGFEPNPDSIHLTFDLGGVKTMPAFVKGGHNMFEFWGMILNTLVQNINEGDPEIKAVVMFKGFDDEGLHFVIDGKSIIQYKDIINNVIKETAESVNNYKK